MLHADGVIGFGDHPPDFILAAVPLPSKNPIRDDAETEMDEVENDGAE
jgi:hypothetical protein